VAAEPLSNVYTVLLLVGLLALLTATVLVWYTLETRYGAAWGVTDEGKQAIDAPKKAEEAQAKSAKDLNTFQDQRIKGFPDQPGSISAAARQAVMAASAATDTSAPAPASATPSGS